MLGAVLEQPGSEVPTMVRTVWQYGMSSFEHLSTGGLEVVLSTCWCLCSYSESHVNDFPGSAAFFCLHKLWRSAIMLTTDPLSTEFKFCRFVLSAASWTSCPLCRARSA